jgi:hypothetical protein
MRQSSVWESEFEGSHVIIRALLFVPFKVSVIMFSLFLPTSELIFIACYTNQA